MITAVIIDDIEDDRKHLSYLLSTFFTDYVALKGEAKNFEESVTLLKVVKPDLVFLDVEILPDGTGFDLLRLIGPENINFGIIFTTQYDIYAIRAFQVAAIDYLLKPIDQSDLEVSIHKFLKYPNFNLSQFEVGFKQFLDPNNRDYRIVLRHNGESVDINCKNIVRCQADGDYCDYYLANSVHNKIKSSYNLGREAEKLSKYSFFVRIDKSHLINLYYIKHIQYHTAGGDIEMFDNTIVKISRRQKTKFRTLYYKFQIKNTIGKFGKYFK